MREHTGVRERVVKPYLSSLGADPLGQHPLPDSEARPVPEGFAEKVRKELGSANVYKEAKIALMWPIWAAAFPDARWVICWRDRWDVAASCMRARFMAHYTTEEEWAEWARQYHIRLESLQQACDCVDIWPHEAITDDVEAYRPVVEYCGLEWDREAVQRVIRRSDWHA